MGWSRRFSSGFCQNGYREWLCGGFAVRFQEDAFIGGDVGVYKLPMELEQGMTVVGLSLRLIPGISVELKSGPRFTAGRYCTLQLSVETHAPRCQRTPGIEQRMSFFANRIPDLGTPGHSGQARHPMTLTGHFGVW